MHLQNLSENIITLGEVFAKLELPLRLGVMSVLSSKKISVLDKQLVKLFQSIEAK